MGACRSLIIIVMWVFVMQMRTFYTKHRHVLGHLNFPYTCTRVAPDLVPSGDVCLG